MNEAGPQPDAAAREYARREAAINKGLRGVMSATLVLEAIVVLLALPVAINTDGGVGPVWVVLICLLAVALIGCCVIIRRPYALTTILVLQALMIAGWFITPTLGVMGLVFAAVWALILWFRAELRRRLAAGTLPEPPPSGS
ncbi:DUF4233 domain-containing protein [Nakamurella sp.]|uniref:DUF4233 domain-containing protein n=1 Tax=Nakamurella sp. TaxID=1869182 RepID=UPI003782D9B4